MERIDYDLLFRWFVGLRMDDPVWNHSVFSKNRDRLLLFGVDELLPIGRQPTRTRGCSARARAPGLDPRDYRSVGPRNQRFHLLQEPLPARFALLVLILKDA
jgi:hypothetical protein